MASKKTRVWLLKKATSPFQDTLVFSSKKKVAEYVHQQTGKLKFSSLYQRYKGKSVVEYGGWVMTGSDEIFYTSSKRAILLKDKNDLFVFTNTEKMLREFPKANEYQHRVRDHLREGLLELPNEISIIRKPIL